MRCAEDGLYPGGFVLFEGSLGDFMYVVESGRLQACVEAVRSEKNKHGVVKEYAAEEFFGELALKSDDEPRSATVRITDDCVLLMLKKRDLPPGLFGSDSDIGAHPAPAPAPALPPSHP